jgi:hypothetical protein
LAPPLERRGLKRTDGKDDPDAPAHERLDGRPCSRGIPALHPALQHLEGIVSIALLPKATLQIGCDL